MLPIIEPVINGVFIPYDYAHPISDALKVLPILFVPWNLKITVLLYDWVIDALIDKVDDFKSRPQQIEFARLNLTNVVMSKRHLRELVKRSG